MVRANPYVVFATALGCLLPAATEARDNGFPDTPLKERQWFQSLMQPDAPMVSCCGEADAYWADDFEIKGDQYVAIVTDERDDTFPNGVTRPHIEPGTRIVVPNGKIKFDAGNPTGHGLIFLGATGSVYCYLPPASI